MEKKDFTDVKYVEIPTGEAVRGENTNCLATSARHGISILFFESVRDWKYAPPALRGTHIADLRAFAIFP